MWRVMVQPAPADAFSPFLVTCRFWAVGENGVLQLEGVMSVDGASTIGMEGLNIIYVKDWASVGALWVEEEEEAA